MLSIAVLTCPARQGSYVAQTIRQIVSEGGRDLVRRLYVDGSESDVVTLARSLEPELRTGWSLERLGEGLGSTEAMRRVLVRSAESGGDLLFFEDDLLLARNAVARMAAQSVPADAGIVTFFDMKEVPPGSVRGLYRTRADGRDGSGFWGAQCLKFPEETVRWLADQDWSRVATGNSRMASDISMGRLLATRGERDRLAVHIPCLVEHVGSTSACFPGLSLSPRWRRASNFPGARFDALSLPAMG